MRSLAPRCLVLSLVSLAALSAAHADNLVTNGGFETGDFSGFTATDARRGSNFGVTFLNAHSGNYAAYFGANDSRYFDMISQPLATVAGGTYNVSFFLDITNGLFGASNQDFQVLWDNHVVYDNSGSGTGNYFNVSLLQTALGNDTLEFRAYNTPSYDYLDDIKVSTVSTPPVTSPVPEPASLALLGTGLLGAVGVIRRRVSL